MRPAPAGFRAIPYLLELELRALPPAQRAVLISLAFLAQYGEPGAEALDGVTARLDVGEALLSIRGLAATLQLGDGSKGESLVRRSLAAGVRLGLISTRPARPKGDAPPDVPRSAPGDTPPDAPRDAPPTIVRWLRHRGILWQDSKGDTPHDARPDVPRDARDGAPGDAIPQSTGHRTTTPSPSARGSGGKRSASPPSPPPPPSTPLGQYLASTWPDIPDPDGFARAQAAANAGIDLLAEAKMALAWEVADGRPKKSHTKFLRNWFRRATRERAARPAGKARVIAEPGDFSDPEKARKGFLS